MTDTIVLEVDIAADCTLQEALAVVGRHFGRIERFEATGPAGGNPCLVIEFPTEAYARGFVAEVDGTDGDFDHYLL